MIKKHSDDPDVAAAAGKAAQVVHRVLSDLPKAKTFDYGGHKLHLGEYGVCERCTSPIAEAQQATQKLLEEAERTTDDTIKEHLQEAAHLFMLEAKAAEVRAEFHNGHNSEPILNEVLGFIHDRNIHDSYDHSHDGRTGA
jgi:G:T/U-mismatch repair DNA glycosylase